MDKPEVYVSTDVEADGPIPGLYSLLSLGAAAFDERGKHLSSFSVNMEQWPGASTHPDTMEWWKTQPEAWALARKDPRPPAEAFQAYVDWVNSLPGTPVFVAYPAGFDFLWVYWGLIRFLGHSPFSFSAIDIKTYAMAVLKKPYRECTKRYMPKVWKSKRRHTHEAVEDAIGQGELFMNMLKANVAGCNT